MVRTITSSVLAGACLLAAIPGVSAALDAGCPVAEYSPPEALAQSARDAFSRVESLGYKASMAIKSGAGGTAGVLSASVMLRRDANVLGIGWKISIHGEWNAVDGGEGRRISVAFDGFSARSIRKADSQVVELVVKDAASLREFLRQQEVLDLVPWDLMRDGTLVPDGHVLFAGEMPGSDASGEKCETMIVQSGDELRRLHVATVDGLPRRVERLATRGASLEAPAEAFRRAVPDWTLEVTDVKRNVPIAESSFIVDVPDGFVVRVFRPIEGTVAATKPPADHAGAPNPRLLAPGSLAPAWRLTDGQGRPVASEDFAGRVVVLDFWGTWCPPCRHAMPLVQSLHEEYQDRGVVVIGMNFERSTSADPVKYMADHGYTYRLARGAEAVAADFRVPGWPTFYVLNREGEVVWGSVGFSLANQDQHAREMKGAIERALAEGL